MLCALYGTDIIILEYDTGNVNGGLIRFDAVVVDFSCCSFIKPPARFMDFFSP